jgi:Flp pilus assembly protein TadG
MMMLPTLSLLRNERGAAAAEMALVTPLLITLMFGSFELGNYFRSEHIVTKSLRDAARFAGRQYSLYSPSTCTAGVITAAPAPAIDNIARYGKLTVVVSDKPIIAGWTTPVTVTLSCPAIGSYSGIYTGKTNVPIVTVTASNVPYTSLFQRLGFTSSNLTLNASSQAAVVGI